MSLFIRTTTFPAQPPRVIPDRTWHKAFILWGFREGECREWTALLDVCWCSAHLGQCEPDESIAGLEFTRYITWYRQVYLLIVWTCPRSRYLSFVPPTKWVWHKAFLDGFRCRAVAQTVLTAPKCLWPRRHYTKNGASGAR